MRRAILLFAAVALVAGGAVTAIATGGGGNTYTACLTRGGAINKVAIGEKPLHRCGRYETQISWSAGVSPEEFAQLTQRVSDLEAMSYGQLDLFVDCAAGDTLGAALDEAQDHPGPVNIVISGVCVESVQIHRDDVSLVGLQRSDGIRSPTDDQAAVYIGDARRVWLSNMTISGGRDGVELEKSSATIVDCTIVDNLGVGISVKEGSAADVRGSEITDNGGSGLFAAGVGTGDIRVRESLIARNGRSGVAALQGGNVVIENSVIEANVESGLHSRGGEFDVRGSRIVDNEGPGVDAIEASLVWLQDTVVEDNAGAGIYAWVGSNVAFWGGLVADNQGDGIVALDLSIISVHDSQILDNDGWGINCGGPPETAEAQSYLDPPSIEFSGNTLGDTNCPA